MLASGDELAASQVLEGNFNHKTYLHRKFAIKNDLRNWLQDSYTPVHISAVSEFYCISTLKWDARVKAGAHRGQS